MRMSCLNKPGNTIKNFVLYKAKKARLGEIKKSVKDVRLP